MIYYYNRVNIPARRLLNSKDKKEVKVNFEKTNQKNQSSAPMQHNRTAAELFLLGATQLLLSLYLPITLFLNINELVLQAISIVASVLAVFAFSRLSVSRKGIVSYILILVIGFMMLGTVMSGFVASLIGSIYILAYLLIISEKSWGKLLALMPSLLAYIISSLLLTGPVLALVALVHLLAAILLAYSFSKKLGRVSVICHTSLGIILTFLIGVAAVFLTFYGTDISALGTAVETMRSFFIRSLSDAFSTVYTTLGVTLSSVDSAELSSVIVNTLFNLLPAIVIIISNIIAFMLQSIMTAFFIKKDTSREDAASMLSFEMSTVSAVVFLTSFLIAAILSNEISVWSATAENISLILMPGLIYTAVFALKVLLFSKNPSCFSALLYIGCIMLFFYIPSVMFTIGALAGAVIIIINNVKKAKAQKSK